MGVFAKWVAVQELTESARQAYDLLRSIHQTAQNHIQARISNRMANSPDVPGDLDRVDGWLRLLANMPEVAQVRGAVSDMASRWHDIKRVLAQNTQPSAASGVPQRPVDYRGMNRQVEPLFDQFRRAAEQVEQAINGQ